MSGSFVLLPQRASLNRRGSFRSAMLRLLRKGTEHGQVSQVSHSQKQFRPLGSLVVFPLLARGGSSTFLTPKRRNGNLSMAQEMQSRPGFLPRCSGVQAVLQRVLHWLHRFVCFSFGIRWLRTRCLRGQQTRL